MKLRQGRYINNVKKFGFQQRSVDTLNELKEEGIEAEDVSRMREKVDY